MRVITFASIALFTFSTPTATATVSKATDEICQGAIDYWTCVRGIDGTKSQLRSYGPIEVDWSVWRPMKGSYVAQSFNAAKKGFYLAVNCLKEKINVTGKEGSWKGWSSPSKNFEVKLIKDVCNDFKP